MNSPDFEETDSHCLGPSSVPAAVISEEEFANRLSTCVLEGAMTARPASAGATIQVKKRCATRRSEKTAKPCSRGPGARADVSQITFSAVPVGKAGVAALGSN